jgi:hypothetical protein
MNVIERTAAVAVELLPTDELRGVLLPPVRALRELAVSVAATVRHWELALEDGSPSEPDAPDWPVATPPLSRAATSSDGSGLDGVFDDIGGAPVTALAEDTTYDAAELVDGESVDVRELPVDDWAELSFADAQARLHDVDEQGLRALVAYETQHGNRLQYTLLLEQRLGALDSSSDA